MVTFCDPNATKALHLGHLRNIAVGDALATLWALAGADVMRQSVVCDVGRAVAETVAGYLSGEVGPDPRTVEQRTDVFVGRCYARYHEDHPADRADEPDPDARMSEHAPVSDADADPATRVLCALRAGDPATTATWDRLRDWVLDGHERTFGRLGIAFERLLFESDSVACVRAVADAAVGAGVFEREPDGAIVMRGGGADGVCVPMIRADGVETGYMRHFAIWHRMQREAPAQMHCINVTGAEWYATGVVREAALSALTRCPLYDSYHRLSVGMVRAEGHTMKSRSGPALLIDDCIDIAERRLLASGSCGIVEAEELGAALLKCAVLARPASKPMSVSSASLWDDRANPGVRLVRAYAMSARDADAAPPRVDLTDRAYRYAVLRAYELPAIWQAAIDAHEPALVVKFMCALADWYLIERRSAAVASIVRATLSAAGASIGLFTDGRPRPDVREEVGGSLTAVGQLAPVS